MAFISICSRWEHSPKYQLFASEVEVCPLTGHPCDSEQGIPMKSPLITCFFVMIPSVNVAQESLNKVFSQVRAAWTLSWVQQCGHSAELISNEKWSALQSPPNPGGRGALEGTGSTEQLPWSQGLFQLSHKVKVWKGYKEESKAEHRGRLTC